MLCVLTCGDDLLQAPAVTIGGDLIPQFALKWNAGVNNFMTYVTGDMPAGAYQSNRLANLGIGHWAIDAGFGYTYFDQKAGREASAVLGFTYNFINPYTQYRAADRVFLSSRGSRRIPQSQSLFRVRRQEPARRMDRIRHVLRRGSGTQAR